MAGDHVQLYSDYQERHYGDLGDELSVPISIFSSMSGLQALVRYLHDQRLSFSEIARLLDRSPKTVWESHRQASSTPFRYSEEGLRIPVARFAHRDLSVLEVLVTYLTSLGFRNVEIAQMLSMDPRNTHTVRKRAEKKGVTP